MKKIVKADNNTLSFIRNRGSFAYNDHVVAERLINVSCISNSQLTVFWMQFIVCGAKSDKLRLLSQYMLKTTTNTYN